MGSSWRLGFLATMLATALSLGFIQGVSQAETVRAPLRVTLGSSQGDVYEGSRLGLIARNAPRGASVTYEVWSGSRWSFGGTKRADRYGSALWYTKVPMGATSVRVRIKVGRAVSRPLTVQVKSSDGWQYWDQTHLGRGGILKRLVTPGGSTITSEYVHPLSGGYDILDAWGERILVSRINGSIQSLYVWDPAMREAQYVMNISTSEADATFGRTPDEILVRNVNWVAASRSQFVDVTAYSLDGQAKELLARFPQDPYGSLSYIEVTSHVVDRATGRLYFTRYWDYYPRRSGIPRDYAVTVLRSGLPPIDTRLTPQQMLTDGTWTERYGIIHRIPTTADLVSDVQARGGTSGYLISSQSYSGGSACTFSLSAAADSPARCVRVNSGEFITQFALQNANLGLVVEYVNSPRDFIVRRINFAAGVDDGMEGRATGVAFGGK